MIYFTSDTHFGSARAMVLSRRPFLSVPEMDWKMINEWNRVVKPDDIVYHLGDFGKFDRARLLNGEIHFLLGNYERDWLLGRKNVSVHEVRAFEKDDDDPTCDFEVIDRINELKNTFDSIHYVPFHKRVLNFFSNIDSDSKSQISEFVRTENMVDPLFCLTHEPSGRSTGYSNCFTLYGHIHGRQKIRK